jgi:hypothetical protein
MTYGGRGQLGSHKPIPDVVEVLNRVVRECRLDGEYGTSEVAALLGLGERVVQRWVYAEVLASHWRQRGRGPRPKRLTRVVTGVDLIEFVRADMRRQMVESRPRPRTPAA